MNRHRQRGFSIIGAIFLIVVIALVAGFLVSIGAMSRTASAFSAVSMRAHSAAAGGVEWAVHQVLGATPPGCLPPGTSFTLAGGGSGTFVVSVVCTPAAVAEGTRSYDIYDIDVTAEFGTVGNEDYFRRDLSASVSTEP